MPVPDRKQPQEDAGRGLLAAAGAAADAARVRVAAAAADLVAPNITGVDAETRLALARLLADLIAAIEDDLRERLIVAWRGRMPSVLVESLAAREIAIAAPVLARARALGDADLVATLLRRVEARRIAERLQGSGSALLDSLLRMGDEPLAAAAMAMLVARSRRGDGPEGPPPATTDLPAELQHQLVWSVAAAIRHHVLEVAPLEESEVDRAIAAAATAALAGYDEDETLEGRAAQVARRLHARRRLHDALIAQAFADGEIVFAVAALGTRAGLAFADVWDMAADAGGARLVVLLRAAGVGRDAAAAAVRAMAPDEDAAAMLDGYDWLDPHAARDFVRPLQADPAYRRACAGLAAGLVPERRR